MRSASSLLLVRMDDGEVALQHAVDGELADAGPCEHRLGEQRAAQEASELQADDRGHGPPGVAQRVA